MTRPPGSGGTLKTRSTLLTFSLALFCPILAVGLQARLTRAPLLPALMEALQGLSELRSALRGNVLLPTEDGGAFHRALQVWAVSPHHSTPPPTPAVVVQPRGETQDRLNA